MTATAARAPRGIVKTQADQRRWREILDPIAHVYCDLVNTIEDYVAGLPDQVLDDHLAAAQSMTTTNCWWASYHVAPLLLEAVTREQFLRNRRRFHGETP